VARLSLSFATRSPLISLARQTVAKLTLCAKGKAATRRSRKGAPLVGSATTSAGRLGHKDEGRACAALIVGQYSLCERAVLSASSSSSMNFPPLFVTLRTNLWQSAGKSSKSILIPERRPVMAVQCCANSLAW